MKLIRGIFQKIFPRASVFYRFARDHLDYLKNTKTKCSYLFGGHEYRFYGPRLKAQFGGREQSGELQAMQGLLGRGVEVFIDIGANLGVFSLLACQSKGGPQTILALEPCAQNFELLVRNISLQKTEKEILCFHWAVSGGEGFETLYGGIEGASLLRGWGGMEETYGEVIQTLSLDRLIALTGCQDKKMLVKVDAEGGEPAILEGARQTIRRGLTSFVVELSLHENKSSPDVEGYLKVFEKMFAEGMQAKTFPTLQEIQRSDLHRWTERRVAGLIANAAPPSPERTLNILFEPTK